MVGRFDGGRISSDGGSLLLREVEKRTHILKRLAGCFIDHRDPELIEHSVESLVKQRVYGIALGYEDLNDHDTLRYDALLGVLGGEGRPKRCGEAPRGGPGQGAGGEEHAQSAGVDTGEGGCREPLQEDRGRLGSDG